MLLKRKSGFLGFRTSFGYRAVEPFVRFFRRYASLAP